MRDTHPRQIEFAGLWKSIRSEDRDGWMVRRQVVVATKTSHRLYSMLTTEPCWNNWYLMQEPVLH